MKTRHPHHCDPRQPRAAFHEPGQTQSITITSYDHDYEGRVVIVTRNLNRNPLSVRGADARSKNEANSFVLPHGFRAEHGWGDSLAGLSSELRSREGWHGQPARTAGPLARRTGRAAAMTVDVRGFSRPPFRSARLVAARHGLVARATHDQAESDFGVRVLSVLRPESVRSCSASGCKLPARSLRIHSIPTALRPLFPSCPFNEEVFH